MNDAGQVAYLAELTGGLDRGVFFEHTALAVVGDTILGQPFTSPGGSAIAIDDRGHVAFVGRLDTLRSLIIAVPEPASLVTLLVASAAGLWRSRRGAPSFDDQNGNP
ncbi:MAG: hypothetical protein CMJ18_19275 [Phycisphaeraceae bacterium]|nr:hypothetical protein [Phycisphaeraceae bacterium]